MTDSPFRKGPSAGMKSPLIALLTKGLSEKWPMKKRRAHAKDSAFCPRRSVFLVNMEERLAQSNAASALYMEIGTAMHRTIARGYKNAGVLLFEELKINEMGLDIGGYADLIVSIDGHPVVVEVKSCGAKTPEVPKAEHAAQVILYSIATGLRNPRLLYVSRSVAGFDGTVIAKEFEIEASEEEMYTMAFNAALGFVAMNSGFVPPIPENIKKSHCGFCPFTKICWGDDVSFIPEMTSNLDEFSRMTLLAERIAADIMKGMEVRRHETLLRIEEYGRVHGRGEDKKV